MAWGPWRRSQGLVAVHSLEMTSGAAPLDLAAVHDAHADFIWRSLQRMGVHPNDLEDGLQEVFLVVHRKSSKFDGSSSVRTWLFGICLRVAFTQRRKARRFRERVALDAEADESVGSNDHPEETFLAREARRCLAEVLDGLDPIKRSVLVMFEVEHLSCSEIAAQMGVPLGTVYSRLSAARADFAKGATRIKRKLERGGR